ncbi:MAG: ComEC/Rec2 family competence protein, partial [Dialister sp.]|nr:ComEC/Rec2 family competence protein [Dialister sp.]MDY5378752.1 ComEC/Rec2 family competence protein [Dialister sp.]
MMIRLGLFWSALLLAAGVFLFEELPPFLLPYGYALLLLSGVIFLLYGHFRGRFSLVLLGAALSLLTIGAFRMALSDALWQEQSHWASRSAGTYEGIVMEEPLVQKGEEGYARYALALVSIRYADGTLQPLSGTCYLYDQKETRHFHPGDRLYAEGEMSPIRLYQNPGKIDLTGRYRSRHLLGRLYLKEGMHPAFAGESGAYRIERFSSEMKQSLKETFAPYMDPVRLSILMTLLFGGNYNDIPEEVMTSFSATGIIHILSVSGSHVALLFGFLYLLGRWLSLPRRLVILPAILLVLFYAVLSGLVPPVIRAAVMGILSVVGIFLDRERETLNLLGAAVFGMLLWDPYYVYDVSFQLSVGASAGILLFYRPILRWMSPFQKLPKWVKEGIALSSAAQLLTIPIMLYDFHRFPVYFIFANLFVTPFLEWVIIAGLIAAIVSLLCRPLMAGLLYAADYAVFLALRLNFLLSSARGAQLVTGGLSSLEIAFYYALLAVVYFRKRLSIRSRMAAGGILS